MNGKNSFRRLGFILLLLLFVLSLAVRDGFSALAQDNTVADVQNGTQLPNLFEPVSAAPPTLALQKVTTAPYVVQYQPAMVDLELLAAMKAEAKLNLNLLPKTSFVGVVERVERRDENRFTVAGYLEDVPNGSFIIVVEEDVAAATIRGPSLSHFFSLRYGGGGVHLICQVDGEKFAPCGGGVSPPEATAETPTEDTGVTETAPTSQSGILPLGTCTAPEPVFDVLIVYSNVARQAAGGTSAIRALCQLAIEETNEAYDNSRINTRVRLVYRGEVTYNEADTYDDHLDRLTSSNDGIMDGVHTLRDTYRADFVSLWVDDPCYCGLGWVTSDASKAFTVVTWGCATGGYTYAHEMGHNQGCEHAVGDGDPPTERGDGLYDFSHGWRFIGDDTNEYRTIMAYAPGTRIQHFSNPNVSFNGQPTGVAIGNPDEAYNARTINLRRSECEDFRLTRFDIWVDFDHSHPELGSFGYPYNTVFEGVSAIVSGVGASELPTLWIKPGTYTGDGNVPITFGKPMTVRSCGGTTIIGDNLSLTASGRIRIYGSGELKIY